MNRRLYCLALGTFALGTDAFIVAGVLPALARDLGVTVGQGGAVVAVFSLVYAVGAPLLATALGGTARYAVLTGSLALFVLANVLSAFSPTLPLLLVTRVVAALAASAYTPTATAGAASLATPATRGRAIAVVTGGLALATVLGVPLGTWVGTAAGWRATFLFVSALGAAALLLVGLTARGISLPPRVPLRARLRVWARADVLLALSVTVSAMTGVFAVYTFIGPLLRQVTVLGDRGIAGVLLVYGVGTLAGNALGGYGTDRWGAPRMLAFAIAGLFVSLPVFSALTLVAPSIATTAVACVAVFVWGAVGWAFNPAQSHRLLSLDPARGPIILSANGSAIHLGIALGSALGALLLTRLPLASLGAAAGASQLLAFALLALGLPSTRLSPQETP